MSDETHQGDASIGDLVALRIQELHDARKLNGDQALLRIDNREETKQAPYQFDTAKGRIHRTGCRSIPESSKSALYGLWEIGAQERKLVCPRCNPVPDEQKRVDPRVATDLFYGLLSVIDQFGGVLRERGKEYRQSRVGQQLKVDLDGMYQGFGEREKEVLDTVLSTLDGIAKMVKDLDEGLNGKNGHNTGNSHNGSAPDE